MWPFSNYCKSCLFRDITIFVAGAIICMVANTVETGAHNGFSFMNLLSIVLGSLFSLIMLYSAWKNRNHIHKMH